MERREGFTINVFADVLSVCRLLFETVVTDVSVTRYLRLMLIYIVLIHGKISHNSLHVEQDYTLLPSI